MLIVTQTTMMPFQRYDEEHEETMRVALLLVAGRPPTALRGHRSPQTRARWSDRHRSDAGDEPTNCLSWDSGVGGDGRGRFPRPPQWWTRADPSARRRTPPVVPPTGLDERCRSHSGCPPGGQSHGSRGVLDRSLNPARLVQELARWGFDVSRHTGARLLDWSGYRRRALRKELITGPVDPQERDQQFQVIAQQRRLAQAQGAPQLCIDTKKKERLGSLHRPGTGYRTAAQRVFDHDYPSLATGTVVPHGVYDPVANEGFLALGQRTARPVSSSVTPSPWPGSRTSRPATPTRQKCS